MNYLYVMFYKQLIVDNYLNNINYLLTKIVID